MSETKEQHKETNEDSSSDEILNMSLDEIYLRIRNQNVPDNLKTFIEKSNDINYKICFIHYKLTHCTTYLPPEDTLFLAECCNQGIGMAFYILGRHHLGICTSESCSKAKFLLEKGCEMNIGSSFAELGYMYIRGFGTNRDYIKAINLFEKGCELGCAHSFSYLADRYRLGEGVEKNIYKARELYRKGMELGDSDSFYNLLDLNINLSDDFAGSDDFDKLAEFAHTKVQPDIFSRTKIKLLRVIHKKNLQNAELKQLMSMAMSKGQADFVITQSVQYLS
jgi:hypothetical protein